ncbi:unnamed protein product [Onchocerca flexuosa]|uniref:UBX domain-containing protein 4 n=1 Tax=Onchocerca flexuosa TaxID=387005 RepID=A0A183HQ94_9BILA|nr:unnamed protein product [Onchocerca flexuosa]
MAEAKMSREERERREIVEQKNREKREQEAYLKKLRQQIKADKEERMNGILNNSMEQNQKAKSALHQTDMPSSVSNSAGCRIQCKFSDGSTLIHQFASTDIFSQLIEIIKKDGRQGDDFYIVQMYPRREFPDITQTFAELGLTPSATVLVLSVNLYSFISCTFYCFYGLKMSSRISKFKNTSKIMFKYFW